MSVVSTNIIIKKHKESKLDDVEFTPDDELFEEKPEAEFMNQPQVEPAVINVDQNGNVVTPVRFQAQNMVINPEAAPVM